MATASTQPLSRQRQRSATRSPRSRSLVSSTPRVGVVGDGLPHPGVDHGHGAARPPVVVVVGREHVGAGPGLEVPADRGVAGLDPPDPVRLGEGHPRPVGQPAGGGADVGALVELDHPGPARPGQHPPVDRGRGRAPALLPRPGLEPDQHPPGHERARPGWYGAPDWEGRRTGRGRPPVVHSPGRGGAGRHRERRQQDGERAGCGRARADRANPWEMASLFASRSDPVDWIDRNARQLTPQGPEGRGG